MDYIGFPFFPKPHLVSKHATLGLVLGPRWPGSRQYPVLQPDVLQVLEGGREGGPPPEPLPGVLQREGTELLRLGRAVYTLFTFLRRPECRRGTSQRPHSSGWAGTRPGPRPTSPGPAPRPCLLDPGPQPERAPPGGAGGQRRDPAPCPSSPPPPRFSGPEPSPPFGS